MSQSLQKRRRAVGRRNPRIEALVERLVRQHDTPESMFELLYWTREPDLLEAVRTIVAMPPTSQAALYAFLAIAGDAQSIAANLNRNGDLTLTAPHIGEALAQVAATQQAPIEIAPALTSRIH